MMTIGIIEIRPHVISWRNPILKIDSVLAERVGWGEVSGVTQRVTVHGGCRANSAEVEIHVQVKKGVTSLNKTSRKYNSVVNSLTTI